MSRADAPRGEDLAGLAVSNRDARVVPLGAFWREGPCLLVFLRHFGCVGCAEQVTELSPRLRELDRAGVRVVFVGNGEPAHLTAFEERHGLHDKRVEIVTDPSLRAFRAAGLVRSRWSTYGPRAIVETARAMSKGHPHRPPDGDPTQQGGVVLVDAAGTVRFYRPSVSIGDHPRAAELVDAALVLAVRSRAVRV